MAIGYRRTGDATKAVKDVFLYAGDDPPDTVEVDGYYQSITTKRGQQTITYPATKGKYHLLRHNLASGSDVVPLNVGSGSTGIYLYYFTGSQKICYNTSSDTMIAPILNLAFAYGDISPEFASTEDLATIYSRTLHGMRIFDPTAFEDPIWERVVGVTGESPAIYRLDASTGFPMSLSYGAYPRIGNDRFHAGDRRVTLYVDRGEYTSVDEVLRYKPRANASLSGQGYYSNESTYGVVTQMN